MIYLMNVVTLNSGSMCHILLRLENRLSNLLSNPHTTFTWRAGGQQQLCESRATERGVRVCWIVSKTAHSASVRYTVHCISLQPMERCCKVRTYTFVTELNARAVASLGKLQILNLGTFQFLMPLYHQQWKETHLNHCLWGGVFPSYQFKTIQTIFHPTLYPTIFVPSTH
jgi:hypothetical protein